MTLRLHRVHFPDRRARRQHFHQREAQTFHLVLQSLADGALRRQDLLHVAQSHALDIDRTIQRGQHLGNVDRVAVLVRRAPERRGGGLVAERRRRRHLPARHAVNRVIDENRRDRFAAVGGMQNLGRADGRQIAVALIRNDDRIGARALQPRRRRGRPPVRHLHVAGVEVVIQEHRAAHG